MTSIHDPAQVPIGTSAARLPDHHVPRQRSLSSASDTSVLSTDSLGDSSHSPEEDEVATLSVALLDAINAGDRPRLTDLLANGSPAAIEQVLATFTYPNTDKHYFHEPEILVDANALLGPSTTRLNLIQIACFLGEEELALDIVNHLAREAESVGSKYALKALLASMWGNGNTTLHLASFLGMAELVAKILEVHPALAKKANDRKVKPVDCTDDDVTRMHFFNTPEVNERIVDNTLRVQSDGALGLLASPMTRGRRSDSSASTTAPSRSILSVSRSIDNLKSMSNGHANKKRVSFDPLTLWFQGAEQGDLAQLSLFLPSIESVDVRLPSRGATALHLACANGHMNAVKWILDRGADANAADDLGLTALHYAADGLHSELLLALIDDPRVDVDVQDADGEGVLDAIDDEEEGGAQLVAKAEGTYNSIPLFVWTAC
ncbi:ankyrin repeat-containing domain protein [Catenaria anguillulae PL171]|uniref:Ankyrin repeat-containing domain protein n=1 Tax=Catenaria anguillulae PL171 TaxID=765915 RepID=A0A1Y2I1J8_9FUNG|nr:ankyrin repeat-containing domain protein [Catenaria anguillulae PL171]